jgi:Transmembrane secretion effector
MDRGGIMTTAGRAVSTWAPLGVGIFRVLWLASLVSNIGTWMQTVGAQWLLVQQPHASILVALVQTADMLPDVLFAYVGGVLADTFDRRWLLIVVQGCLFITGLALTVLTIAGQIPPALLLTPTFVLGAGSAFSVPAYQAMLPDLIPRAQLPSASALGSININLARAVGPAIAGVLIAQVGGWSSLRHQHSDVSRLWTRGRCLAPCRRHDSTIPRAVRPGAAGWGAVRSLLPGGPPHSDSFGAVSRTGQRTVGAAARGRQSAARTRCERLWSAAGRARGRCHCWRIHAPTPARQAVEQLLAVYCQSCLRGGAGRAGAGAERRSDPGHAHTGRDRVDRCPLEHECRDATLSSRVGARPRSVGLSDGPLRRTGSGCRDLGPDCRASGTRGDLSHCSSDHGRRDSHDPSLAPLRHERH